MRRILKALVSFVLIMLMLGLPSLLGEPARAASQQIFTSQDAVVPGLNIRLTSGSDPATIVGVTGGQRLWPVYYQKTVVNNTNIVVSILVFLNYGDVPQEAYNMFNTTAQTYFSPGWIQTLKTDNDLRIIKVDIQPYSKTVVRITQKFDRLNYYLCYADKLVYDPQHPNFDYFIMIDAHFLSESVFLSTLDLLANHFQAVIESKVLRTPTVTATFADGSTSGPAGASITLKGSSWAPNTAVTLNSSCFDTFTFFSAS